MLYFCNLLQMRRQRFPWPLLSLMCFFLITFMFEQIELLQDLHGNAVRLDSLCNSSI